MNLSKIGLCCHELFLHCPGVTVEADVLLFRYFGDVVNNKELGFKGEPFGSSAKTEALLASFPKIKAIVENVRANAKLQAYLAARPQVA